MPADGKDAAQDRESAPAERPSWLWQLVIMAVIAYPLAFVGTLESLRCVTPYVTPLAWFMGGILLAWRTRYMTLACMLIAEGLLGLIALWFLMGFAKGLRIKRLQKICLRQGRIMTEKSDGPRLIEVAAGIIWRGGRFLAAQRPTDKPLEGYWEFPGGKLEAGECPEAALERELREELAIETRTGRVLDALRLNDRNGGDLLMLFYESEIVRGEPQTVECRALDWTLPKDVAAYDLAPADRLFLQRRPELFAAR